MSLPRDLATLQRWMQHVITHPGGVAAGIESDAARREIDITAADIERVIDRSQAQTSIERLHVYGNAYFARLIGCMAAEFPATQHAAGEEAFGGFVFGFLQEHPSTSYTLSDLGAAFPRYLARSRPPQEGDAPDWADFLVDLATLEREYSGVFDGPGEEHLTLMSAEELKAIPPERWGEIRLQTAPSLRFVELRFPVHEYASAVQRKEPAIVPPPETTRLAIHRREYIVRRRTLDPLPFDLLRRLHSGTPLGEAIEQSLESAGETADTLAKDLQGWFRGWTAAGYFVGVTDHSSTK